MNIWSLHLHATPPVSCKAIRAAPVLFLRWCAKKGGRERERGTTEIDAMLAKKKFCTELELATGWCGS